MRILIVCLLALAQCPLLAAQESEGGMFAPEDCASPDEIRAWIEGTKGCGTPQMMQADLIGLHVMVVWNSPFSGRDGCYVYAYYLRATTGRWHLLDSSFFERPEPLSFAYVDGCLERLMYIGFSGKVLKSISLNGIKFQ